MGKLPGIFIQIIQREKSFAFVFSRALLTGILRKKCMLFMG